MRRLLSSLLDRLRGARPPRLAWTHRAPLDGLLELGGWRFHVCLPDAMAGKPTSDRDFVVVKVPSMIDRVAELFDPAPRNIVELGILGGGSTALYSELFRPDRLLAIDLNAAPVPLLDGYIRRSGLAGRVVPRLGVDQADRATVARLVEETFGGRPLDLVVDDASHYLHESRESFRELFPRLAPGGAYVIEDWAWAHWQGDVWQAQDGGDHFRGKEPMSNLLVELVVLAASRPDVIARVSVEFAAIVVTRGDASLEPGFDPAPLCLNRGRALPRFT